MVGGGRAGSGGEETPVRTNTVSIAIGRGAEKSGISLSWSRQHVLTIRQSQTDMTHGLAYAPEKGKEGRLSESTFGSMGVLASVQDEG